MGRDLTSAGLLDEMGPRFPESAVCMSPRRHGYGRTEDGAMRKLPNIVLGSGDCLPVVRDCAGHGLNRPACRRGHRFHREAGRRACTSMGAVGLVAGVLLGILSRPSYPLAGQMPIGVVLSRGAGLTGMDLLFKSAAEDSFNHVLIVTIIGIVAGAGLGWYLGSRNASATSAGPVTISPRSSEGSPQDLTTQHAFCMTCGTRLPSVAAFCPSCGTKREGVVG